LIVVLFQWVMGSVTSLVPFEYSISLIQDVIYTEVLIEQS